MVFEAITTERIYQNRKWGLRTENGFVEKSHSVGDFLVYMQSYLGDAFHAASHDSGDAGALEALRKVVTLGVACFEQHGVRRRDLTGEVINGHDGQPA